MSEESAERVTRLRRHLADGTTDRHERTTSLRAAEYRDGDIAEAEREFVFGRAPVIAAHSSELSEPGDFVRVSLPRNEIVLVRQQDGSVRALVNACRHRAAMVVTEPQGRCRLLSCPYHRWSYNLDGSLRTMTRADTVGDVDPADRALVPLPCEERHGLVWVVDNATAELDVAKWLGPEMDAILAALAIDRHVVFESTTFDEPVNWKVMQDGFLDFYHLEYAHPATAGKLIHTNVAVLEDFGRTCRWTQPRKSISRADAEPPDSAVLDGHLTETHFLGPNSTLVRHPDHLELLTFRPHPTDPARSVMELRLIAPLPGATGLDPEAWTRRWTRNWDLVLEVLTAEDLPILRGTQEAVRSRDAGDMMLGRNEIANHVFWRELAVLLADRPDPDAVAAGSAPAARCPTRGGVSP
ncbi:aromatic ring-hydroxylating oxygenase subunit alpha [Pseudonocardia pini]|uniref:aromatic ring-hydroxylating oxygenase subunit alpha n=1 Tax=Pseudonocardia pini TaxID=2758030 RepID=UPI0015F02932|nr:aromatic ring-hydroxylating dioxygenase subunit alpha [Pseudonocardia pini]